MKIFNKLFLAFVLGSLSLSAMATEPHNTNTGGEGDQTNSGNTNDTTYSTDDTYEQGAFNFTENTQSDVVSTINDNAIVHGDSNANVAGNQYNCSTPGSCAEQGTENGYVMSPAGINGKFVNLYDKYGEILIDEETGKELKEWRAYSNNDTSMYISDNNTAAAKAQSNSKVEQTVLTTPSMAAPMVSANNSDMCRHGVSAAASMVGMGVSGGITLIDKNCEMLKNSRLLQNLGLKDVALALLGQDDRIATAMMQADPKRYGAFIDIETVRNLEEESAEAERKANRSHTEWSEDFDGDAEEGDKGYKAPEAEEE